eukprot:535310-Rhodomonas_salina.1
MERVGERERGDWVELRRHSLSGAQIQQASVRRGSVWTEGECVRRERVCGEGESVRRGEVFAERGVWRGRVRREAGSDGRGRGWRGRRGTRPTHNSSTSRARWCSGATPRSSPMPQ